MLLLILNRRTPHAQLWRHQPSRRTSIWARCALIALGLLLAFVEASRADTLTQQNAAQVVAGMGAGWNLGNQLEATGRSGRPDETAWANPRITHSLIKAIKAAGFRTIRIPVSYLNHIGEAPNYQIHPKWLARVKAVVDYAYTEGLYVIINIHGDGYHSIPGAWLLCDATDQIEIRAKYQRVWQQISIAFAAYDQRLIFESLNEEFDGHTYSGPVDRTHYSNINAYNQIFVDTVRLTGGNNASRWLLVPGWNTNIDLTAGDYGFVIPTDRYRSDAISKDERRIMISVHYYDPWDFCGDPASATFEWGVDNGPSPTGKASPSRLDYMESRFKLMHEVFVQQGYPFVVGEFGSIDKSYLSPKNMESRVRFTHALCAAARKFGGVPVVWDDGTQGKNSFGLFDRAKLIPTQPAILQAIQGVFSLDAASAAGDSVNLAENETTRLQSVKGE